MTLGEKLKAARLEAGLSQKALCGDTITRNMLSQIESGRARPSMDTLRILAGRLGKPMSAFLEERLPLEDAKQAYGGGAYREALALLDACPADGEASLLRLLCLLELAQSAVTEGRFPYARELLERAGQVELPYRIPGLERERLLLLAKAGARVELPPEDETLLYQAAQALDRGDGDRGAALLQAVRDRGGRWQLLMGRSLLARGAYSQAAVHLHSAEAEYPEAVPLLEQCYRELGDYKLAYEYACRQRL